MNEDAARTVLLVQSVEEGDAGAEILTAADRRWATREAAPPETPHVPRDGGALTPEAASFLVRRARLLRRTLESRFPCAMAAPGALHWRGWVSAALAILSFALGLALNALGPSRHINILSFPLLGMLAWNLAVYGALLADAARSPLRRRGPATPRGPLVALVSAVMAGDSLTRRLDSVPPALVAGLRAFATRWSTLAAPLYAARSRRVLHLCAAVLAAGAVVGMYWRGIAFEYRAGWESTFLGTEAVHAILSLVLAPASALTGIPVPDVGHIASLRWNGPDTGENAAPWIHLYAATALIGIVLPRLVLALTAAVREGRLRSDFPLPDDLQHYWRRVLAARHGYTREAVAHVVPYNHTLGDAARRALEERLSERTGTRITTRVQDAVRYGEEDDHLRQLRAQRIPDDAYVAVVFSMSATPEEENQGLLLHGYRTAVASAAALLVVVDEAPYRRRLAGQAGADARLAERRAAWTGFARAHGIDVVALDLDPGNAQTALAS